MPIAKLCSHPACREIVRDGSHRCIKHRKKVRTKEVIERSGFYSTTRWRNFSLIQRQARPICEMCKKELASDADHWLERSVDADELYWFDERNIVCLCKSCHYRKGNIVKRFIEDGNYIKLYQWCLVNHPRQSEAYYLHDWIKTKEAKGEEAST
ncbi:hypothetical protein [Vibrio parahaemolyticus]|uniref:hypothetical protein n=1 Tax=Vibrio parahaemolyticus TaxID=670 RepID=UPI001131E6FA|nr:hypothetical protein [Vibrio parahaemolyticus]